MDDDSRIADYGQGLPFSLGSHAGQKVYGTPEGLKVRGDIPCSPEHRFGLTRNEHRDRGLGGNALHMAIYVSV